MIPFNVVTTLAALSASPDSSSSVDVRTALLFAILVAMVFCIKIVAEMRQRLLALEAKIEEAPAAAEESSTLTPEIVAVISAAIITTVGSNHRIVSVAPIGQEKLAWSLEGRRQVFQSHKLR